MPNFKTILKKDYTQNTLKMVSFGAHFLKVNHMAIRFCKTMTLTSWKLTRFARDSLRKRPSISLRAH